MELRVLNYFLVIANEKNFTKASQLLHITQPTLSRQIAQLEKELGTKLFIRNNHNISLTEDGLILKRRAQEILSLADKTVKELSYNEKELEGVINIGCGEFLSSKILGDIIADFRKKYPLVQFDLHSGNGYSVFDRIESGLLDIGLVQTPIDIDKYNYVAMPIKELWGVYNCEECELANKEFVEPKDLKNVPLIVPMNKFMQQKVNSWLGKNNGNMIVGKGNLMYNQAMMGKSTESCVVGIELNCKYDGLKFVPFSPKIESETVLIWKKDCIFSTATSTFIEFIEQYLKGITND